MERKILMRVFGIAIILAIVDVVLYANGIIGIGVSLISTQKLLISILMVILNCLILGFEIKYLMTSTEIKYGYDMDKLKDADDYKQALQSGLNKKNPFNEEIKQAMYQIESIDRKRRVLDELLEQNNKEYFTALVELGDETKSFIFVNAKKILNIISIFDEKEYENSKNDLLKEHREYITNILDSNNKLINQFNNFLTEVSKIGDTDAKVNVSKILEEMTNSLKSLRGEN
jgi:hypothetical protein